MGRATLNKGGSWGVSFNEKIVAKVKAKERMTVMPKLRISLLSLSHSGPFSGSIASYSKCLQYLPPVIDGCMLMKWSEKSINLVFVGSQIYYKELKNGEYITIRIGSNMQLAGHQI